MPDISFDSVGGQSLEKFARQRGLGLTRFAYLVSGDRDRADVLVQDVLLAMHQRFGARLDLDQPLAHARRAIATINWSRRGRNTEVLTATDVDRPVTAADPGSGDELWQGAGVTPAGATGLSVAG